MDALQDAARSKDAARRQARGWARVAKRLEMKSIALALSAPIAWSFLEPHRLVVRRFDVAMDDLPAPLDGLRVAQLSDLHCSAITSSSVVRRAVQTCNALHPDLVVLTGDYVSRRNSYSHLTLARQWARPLMQYAAAMADEVRHLRAPQGVFAVAGNHDYAEGSFDAIRDALEQAGIQTLVNQNVVTSSGLPLVGLDDLRAGHPDAGRAFSQVAADEPHLVLSHNPRVWPLVQERLCLLLAGHTHGGQVHLPGTNFRRKPSDMRHSALIEGWSASGRARLYISSGIGSVHFPMRFNCPPEIAVFTLRRPA